MLTAKQIDAISYAEARAGLDSPCWCDGCNRIVRLGNFNTRHCFCKACMRRPRILLGLLIEMAKRSYATPFDVSHSNG